MKERFGEAWSYLVRPQVQEELVQKEQEARRQALPLLPVLLQVQVLPFLLVQSVLK